MRTRRFLLAASALSTLAFGCTKDKPSDKPEITGEPLPGNPKGSLYDANVMEPPPLVDAATAVAPVVRDAADAEVPPPRDAGLQIKPGPTIRGNPKGSRYDKGLDPNE
jgi:hypothetical protein